MVPAYNNTHADKRSADVGSLRCLEKGVAVCGGLTGKEGFKYDSSYIYSASAG